MEGFSVVWEVNQVKELQIKTHLAPLLLPEGSGSNQVGLCKLQNKILACRSCYLIIIIHKMGTNHFNAFFPL